MTRRLAMAFLLASTAAREATASVSTDCAARIAALRARFDQAERRPHPDTLLTTVAGIEPLLGARGAPVERSFVIVERGLTATSVDGQPVPATVAGIRKQIEATLATRRLLHADTPAPPHIGLLVDRRIRARDALELAEGLGAAYDVDLVTREAPSPAVPEPPPPARVVERMEAIRRAPEFSQKLQLGQQAVAGALAGCAGHESFFAAIKEDDPAREAHLHQAILSSAAACSCVGIDLDMLGAIVLAVDDDPPPFHALPLRVRKQAKRKLALPSAATVGELAGQLPSPGEPFAVRWLGKAPAR